ncbi:U4/U6 small nuclear ribonucleoprotein prp4 [Microbotryomycetes sp. JL201]|nr:U4/U6 small nuclear ribonucleoprotein prp4 [Microbotryomycetes sp. JL201]
MSLDEPEEGEIQLNYSDAPAPSAHPPRRADSREPVDSRQARSMNDRTASAPQGGGADINGQSNVSTNTPGNAQGSENPVDEPELELELPKPVDPDAIIAERRRRRAEILAKYASNAPTPTDVSRLGTPEVTGTASGSRTETPGRASVERDAKRIKLGTDSPDLAPTKDSDQDFELFKGATEDAAARVGEQDSSTHVEGEEEISAADYNPNEDRKNDDRRFAEKTRDGLVKETKASDTTVKSSVVIDAGDEDDDDDMFAVNHKVVVEPEALDGKAIPIINRADAVPGLVDNFDDEEGYYRVVLGELLDGGRYHVHANLGKGMFSSVVRAKDMESKTGEEVAIKLIRSQESMYKAGQKEANILRKLMDADPDDKKHLIRMTRTFDHRGHLCLVFESMSMNLREVVKRFGKDVGINLRAVRAYASQLFLALALLRKCEIMHADIKPDNVLVNESKSTLKLSDLGSASDVTENDITPYLVSRFYRAPEIILGLPYDYALDTWSIACTLYELYTGKILFPGRTNNHMLLLIMELKGKFNHKQLKKGKFTDQHFDESLNFLSLEKNGEVKTMVIPSKATHDLRSRLMPASAMKRLREDEVKVLGQFVDLLDKMLSLDPSKRPTPKEMLNHPFIRGVA